MTIAAPPRDAAPALNLKQSPRLYSALVLGAFALGLLPWPLFAESPAWAALWPAMATLFVLAAGLAWAEAQDRRLQRLEDDLDALDPAAGVSARQSALMFACMTAFIGMVVMLSLLAEDLLRSAAYPDLSVGIVGAACAGFVVHLVLGVARRRAQRLAVVETLLAMLCGGIAVLMVSSLEWADLIAHATPALRLVALVQAAITAYALYLIFSVLLPMPYRRPSWQVRASSEP